MRYTTGEMGPQKPRKIFGKIGSILAGLGLASSLMMVSAAPAAADNSTSTPTANVAASAYCNGFNYQGPFVPQGLGYSSHATVMLDSCVSLEVADLLSKGYTGADIGAAIAKKFPATGLGATVWGVMSGAAGDVIQNCALNSNGRGIIFTVVSAASGATLVANCRAQSNVQPDPPNCPPGDTCPFSLKKYA